MHTRYLILAWAVLLLFGGVASAAETLVDMEGMQLDEIQAVGIELTRPGKIEIEARGVRSPFSDDLVAYAWILDHESREPVWVMRNRGRSSRWGRSMVDTKQTEELKAGKYEVYLCTMDTWSGNWFDDNSIDNIGDLFRVLRDAFRGKDARERDRGYDPDDCYVRLTSNDIGPNDVRSFEVNGDMPGALIRHTKLGNDEYVRDGFTLTKPMSLRIYAVIEFPDGYDAPVDGGWIVNADTRERVWSMDRWNTEYAGGADKNQKVDEEVKFEPGNYIVTFATDDSHAYSWFNMTPPWDPLNWGITILPGRGFDKAAFKEYTPPGRGDALVDMTRIRDDDYQEQAFKLSREIPLLVRCLGEYSEGSDEFVDYGMIQDLASGRVVWEMTRRNTEPAGGASKNRMFEGMVTLPKGTYLALYSTDGSHSYRDWNAAEPFDREAWGLAIYPGKDYRKGDFVKVDAADALADSDVLAQITRVRDDQERRERFSLDRDSRVRIHALGEGTDGRMYDYGWIEDARTGRTVWEMTYRKTRHGGGAQKNRVFDGEIDLRKGDYEVFFITDGSHSYNDWNADRPRNPASWGITVSKSSES